MNSSPSVSSIASAYGSSGSGMSGGFGSSDRRRQARIRGDDAVVVVAGRRSRPAPRTVASPTHFSCGGVSAPRDVTSTYVSDVSPRTPISRRSSLGRRRQLLQMSAQRSPVVRDRAPGRYGSCRTIAGREAADAHVARRRRPRSRRAADVVALVAVDEVGVQMTSRQQKSRVGAVTRVRRSRPPGIPPEASPACDPRRPHPGSSAISVPSL